MPQLPFADEHKASIGILDFPRLKLEKDGRARILCIEDPTFAYVHELRAPKIVDGKPNIVTIERNGSKTQDFEKDFIGRQLCLGDLEAVSDKGVDASRCPACQRSTVTDEVDPPKRRFAMPVIVYATKPGSFELRTPFSCELQVWGFTDRHYNTLVDLVSEWGENGKIRNHDLCLGPCKSAAFQQFEIKAASTAAWLQDEDRKQLVMETYRANRPANLEIFCGRQVQRDWMIQDLEKVRERWAIANGRGPSAGEEYQQQGARQLTEGLDKLLDETNKINSPVQADVTGLLDDEPAKPATADNTTASTTTPGSPPQSPSQSAPVSAPKSESKAAPMDFDDLLNSLG
jgi:hypothetical protein